MLASIFSLNVIQTALELGCIYALVALALFLSYSILNIADLSTDLYIIKCRAKFSRTPIFTSIFTNMFDIFTITIIILS